jgi:peroxiredoxin
VEPPSSRDLLSLPPDLPIPEDDGAAQHLLGATLPAVALLATDGRRINLGALPAERTVLYCYPRTGRPGEAPLTADWDAIPGARGCTLQSCSYRDHYRELSSLGVAVFGVSTQDSEYQREAVARLHLPFPLLSDSEFELTNALQLPTFEVAGQRLLKRLTLVVRDGRIEHVRFPVFPPDRDAEEVLALLGPRMP